MPIARPYGNGSTAATSPPCNLRRTIILADDAPVSLTPLLVEGLPNLFLWAWQTVGGVAGTMLWEWTARVSPLPGGGDDWLPLLPATSTPLVVAAPVYYNIPAFSAKRIRLRLTRSPGVATTVEIFYGGTV